MATNYYPDFSKLSQYNPESATILMKYGADAPVTEMELNEIQLIQNQKRKELLAYFITNGFEQKGGSIKYTNGVLTILNKRAFIDGYTVYIDSAALNITSGSAYLNVWEKEIGVNDAMKKYGNENGVAITNYILDARYGQEISHRIQLVYALEATQRTGAKSIKLGTITSGVMAWEYPEATTQGTATQGTKDYLYANAREIPFTPAELAAKRDKGDFSGLDIGDYKTIALEGEMAGKTIVTEIAGLDIYYGYSTNNKHSIDFVIRDVLCKHRVNATNSNIGGYVATELYTYLETTIWNCMPQEWKNVIQPKGVLLENKAAADSTSWEWKWLKLWLLADEELFSYASWSQRGYGNGNFKQYPLFRSERHLIKKFNGSAHWYWLIQPSVYGDKTTHWCHCATNGSSSSSTASGEDGGVVFGFRI